MRLTSITVMVAGVALLAGCSLGESAPSDVEAGSLAEGVDLEGAQLTVGGKEFTEQLVLCELTAQALESAGATVDRSCGMSGSSSVRSALESGDVDLYWEYTGTGWVNHLGESELISDPQELYTRLDESDREKNGLAWLEPAPANNTYAMAVATETADELSLSTLSDYAELAGTDPEQASFCGAAEFFGRDDGWTGLQKAYHFQVPDSAVSELAAGAVYSSIDKGRPCAFGEVFATDGRIAALGLTVLEDDLKFFPIYNPSVSINAKVLEADPGIEEVLAPIAEALDNETLQELNGKVDVDGETPEQVANDWLVSEGFVK
ncbi:glycine betaine ABC transporter substrate-binding protein [Nocardioides sp. LHG3406-4]|uniref:glycine betaine ABC transporter substrate-binding protein n=1 Tax=Nocardioides sp. LHG3406-4 TaxID=2804575 RepID=UPI003CED83DF